MKKILPIIKSNAIIVVSALLMFVSASKVNAQTGSCQAYFTYSFDTTANTITVNDTSWADSSTIISYQWTYNASSVGTNSGHQTFSVASINHGDSLCLTITTDSGCVSFWCEAINLSPPCSIISGYFFTHDSLGNYIFWPSIAGGTPPFSYSWTASNGASTTSDTFYVQLSAGVNTVCLSVIDSGGCTDTYCSGITVSGTVCPGCTPQIYYIQDSLNPNLFTFYDTTTYLTTPTSDSWMVNGVSTGSGSVFSTTLTSTGGVITVCRAVTVPGCSVSCPSSACLQILPNQFPGIHIFYFNTSTNHSFCTAPDSVYVYFYGNLSGYSPGDTVHINLNFDDGSDTTFDFVTTQNYFYGNLGHIYQNSGTYIPQIIVYSPDYLYSDTALIGDTLNGTDPIVITNTCGDITGTLYLDNNANCVFDAGDSVIAYKWVTMTDGVHYWYTSSDSNGVYSFNVPVGPTYIITVHMYTGSWYSGHYQVICPAGGSLSVTAVPSSGNNFYFGCPQGFDLDAHVSGWGFVPGRTAHICVYPFDHRCGAPNGQVILILDSSLTPLPDTSGHYTIQGDSVIWNITPTGSFNTYYHSYCVPVVVPTTASIGDSICVTVIVTPITGDSVPSNNTQTKCWAVRTSYDPNDKAATPEGEGVTHAIRPGTELTYTIRFQNTGNASAQDVYILDQLDANLDPGTLEVLAASHSMIPTLLTGNIIRFDFPNINLPDSNENETLSHGYVTYRISPWSSVANGTIINNSADIYFDYNPPVLTNIVFHTIDFTIGLNHVPGVVNSTLFPNPADGEVFVLLPKPGKTEINMFDITGKLVMNRTMVNSGMLDIRSLPSGAYKVQMIREDSIQNSSLIIAR